MSDLFADLPAEPPPAEITEVLAETSGARVERIVSYGHATPLGQWYDQAQPEWVAVLSGWGTLRYDDGSLRRLGPGQWEYIPARRRHRVEATDPDQPTVWLAVFLPA